MIRKYNYEYIQEERLFFFEDDNAIAEFNGLTIREYYSCSPIVQLKMRMQFFAQNKIEELIEVVVMHKKFRSAEGRKSLFDLLQTK